MISGIYHLLLKEIDCCGVGAKMKNIRVIVSFKIKDNDIECAVQHLKEFIKESRLEIGNLSMEVLKSTESKNQFWFVELWESEEAVLKHTRSEHFKIFAAFFIHHMQEINVKQMIKMQI